ncbi:PepSY-associated TM region [Halopseudomonas litoralis]|uniref:PepSY-associated TM region n=1 Tax=Halopseudomonas litoralis TaxID=797277 RepID=A0A1H1URY0_9GAMM|nr:PepSY domain-containing protein [Halopseudomonas litoralis]SDS74619.1 PepSY-associated TM region [Halopseudomonas litoralis]
MKRYLYLWHRWLGIGLCLLLALWFVSGLVMLYVGYPKLTFREHLAQLPPLAQEHCCVPLSQVLNDAGPAPDSIRLTTVAGEPRYMLRYGQRTEVRDARSGAQLGPFDQTQALAAVRQFAGEGAVRYQGLVDEDAWTHSRGLDADRPLHRVALGNGTLLYISSRSGGVVRDATATERGWNWVGAWLHWVYPLRGGVLDRWWTDIVIYLSLAATLMTLLGIVVGLLRWRFSKPYRNGSRSPYRGFARWHHVGGLLFGVLALTWIFSGLMSMNPWRVFASPVPLDTAAYTGGELRAAHFPLAPEQVLQQMQVNGMQVRELHWRLVGGQGYVLGVDGDGDSLLLSADSGEPLEAVPEQVLWRAAQAIRPQDELQVELLSAFDFYYYDRAQHSMLGHLPRPLPILRVRFADPAQTWLHIDPVSGALLGQLDQRQRASRWLFALLHSWDWLPLLERRPLWDGWMWLGSIGGLVISVSGTVLGWRRLRRSRRRRGSVRSGGVQQASISLTPGRHDRQHNGNAQK